MNMTLANRITMLRALMAVGVFVCIVLHGVWFRLAALALFCAAAFTDWLDGKIARETGTVTHFGAIADPFVDKILVGGAFLAFASIKSLNVPLWAVFIIIARELMVSSLRALAALGGKVLSAEKAGKFKTFFQLLAAFAILLVLNFQTMLLAGSGTHTITPQMVDIYRLTLGIPYWISVLTALVTAASGAAYLYNHWAMLQDSWSDPHLRKAQKK